MFNLFSCCCHRRQASLDDLVDIPDERSHLIPASSEELDNPASLGLPSAYIDDQQRLKERMESIVRAKEGKMVNVNARLPFNLHNHPTSSIHGNPSSSSSLSLSSSSRSLSTAALASAATLSSSSGTPHTHAQVQVHVGAPLPGPSNLSRNLPYQRDSSQLSRSSSSASRETGASDDGSLVRRRQVPILGLRLVRVPISNAANAGRRGRKKRKPSAEEVVTPQTSQSAESMGTGAEEQGTPRPRRTSYRHITSGTGGVTQSPVDENTSPPSISGSESEMTPRVEHPHGWAISVSPASEGNEGVGSAETGKSGGSPVGFVLKDEGPLTVSWGE